jgi:hypothetical protein
MRVDELHGHRALADCRRTSFRRTGADVAGREDARHACLEQVVGTRGHPGEDEPVLVARHGVAEPVGARRRSEEEEQERERDALAALQRDRLQMPVVAV